MIFRVKGMSFAHEVMINCTDDVNIRQILTKKEIPPTPESWSSLLNS